MKRVSSSRSGRGRLRSSGFKGSRSSSSSRSGFSGLSYRTSNRNRRIGAYNLLGFLPWWGHLIILGIILLILVFNS